MDEHVASEAAGRRSSEAGLHRTLGEAWSDWDPVRDDGRGDTRAAPALFLIFATLVVIAAAAALRLLFWLAEPRLLSLGVDALTQRWLFASAALLILLPAALLWSVFLGLRPPFILARALLLFVIAIWTVACVAARLMRVSRDRLGHSFVLLQNRLALFARRARSGRELLVLAPRCLRPEMRRHLQLLAAEAGAQFAVVGGGEQALATLASHAPAAVLAVACERDLVAGLRDVAPALPVLGLPNRRPEGPCRNSEIDLEEARRMLAKLRSLLDQA